MEATPGDRVTAASFVGEAECSWGRVRVSVWCARPLARAERAALAQELGRVHTELECAGVGAEEGLERLRAAVAIPRLVRVAAEVLRSDRGVRSNEPAAAGPARGAGAGGVVVDP